MSIFKTFANLFLASLVLMSFFCEKEEDDNDTNQSLDSGNIEVDGYWFVFENISTNEADTFKYGNFDTETTNYDTIRLDRSTNATTEVFYDAKIMFFKGQDNVTSEIRDNGFDYIVCYRGLNIDHIRLQERDKDINDRILGLESEWTTVGGSNQNVIGDIRITLNYQRNKENLCDAGVRVFDFTVPYLLY